MLTFTEYKRVVITTLKKKKEKKIRFIYIYNLGPHKPLKYTAKPGKSPLVEQLNGEAGSWWDCQVMVKSKVGLKQPEVVLLQSEVVVIAELDWEVGGGGCKGHNRP